MGLIEFDFSKLGYSELKKLYEILQEVIKLNNVAMFPEKVVIDFYNNEIYLHSNGKIWILENNNFQEVQQ